MRRGGQSGGAIRSGFIRGGQFLVLLLALLIVASAHCSFAWRSNRHKAAVTAGVFWFQRLGSDEHDTLGWRFAIIPIEGGFAHSWTFRWWLDHGGGPVAPFFIVPLWIPLAVVAGLTCGAWSLSGRAPPLACRKCRYDLTGNMSGRCPECGLPTVRPPAP